VTVGQESRTAVAANSSCTCLLTRKPAADQWAPTSTTPRDVTGADVQYVVFTPSRARRAVPAPSAPPLDSPVMAEEQVLGVAPDEPKVVSIYCSRCDKAALADVAGTVSDYDPDHGPDSHLGLVRCQFCKQGLLFIQENYGDGWDDLYRLWPPQDRTLSHAVPDPCRR
jgi:hypothetical protein